MFEKVKKVQSKKTNSTPKEVSSVSSRDATLHYLYNRVMSEATEESHQDLAEHLDMRIRSDKVFQTIFEGANVEEAMQPTKFDCLRFLMNAYETHCESFNDYSLKHVRYLSNHCETAEPAQIFDAARAFATICQ
jgi:vacuolar-type H+-ATPase catalytic subunit A/Vma1